MSRTRVLIVSQRDRPDGFGRQPGYVPFLEAEDVLAACTGADMVQITQDLSSPRVRLKRVTNGLRRQIGGRSVPKPGTRPQARRSPGSRNYDLTVFVAMTPWDLPLLQSALKGVRTDRIVVWFPELWSSALANKRLSYEPFEVADTIFVGMWTARDQLAAMTPGPVQYLPMAVDVARFSGLGRPSRRPLDVMAIGRREPKVHEVLLDWSRHQGRMYLYDTISGATVRHPAEHRDNLAETYRRSSVAITNYAKFDQPVVCGHDREIPGRLWEAMAAGTLMIGLAPDPELQQRAVGQQVVRPLADNPDQALDQIKQMVMDDSSDQREHLMNLAANGHDWAHRWREVFHLLGLELPAGIEHRIQRLAELR